MRLAHSLPFLLLPIAAVAQTATDEFEVRITIRAECQIVSAQDLDFGSVGVLSAATNATATLNVACSNTTPYYIGLNEGLGATATTTVREMTGGAETINYRIFRDAGRTINWGNANGIDTASGIGNGASQPYTLYGQVPAQTTPTAGTYTDTVTVTVTF